MFLTFFKNLEENELFLPRWKEISNSATDNKTVYIILKILFIFFAKYTKNIQSAFEKLNFLGCVI